MFAFRGSVTYYLSTHGYVLDVTAFDASAMLSTDVSVLSTDYVASEALRPS